MTPAEADRRAAHRRFLDRLYRPTRGIYDVTRRFLLFGRDRVLDELLAEPWTSLLEIGPGTGRNLRYLHARRPRALLGGLEASLAMLEHAARRAPWARLEAGFAEDADLAAVLGVRPERVLLSYALSMTLEPARVLERAALALAPGGVVHVVDFGDARGLGALARPLRAWLRLHHVHPVDDGLLRAAGARPEHGRLRYHVRARIVSSTSSR